MQVYDLSWKSRPPQRLAAFTTLYGSKTLSNCPQSTELNPLFPLKKSNNTVLMRIKRWVELLFLRAFCNKMLRESQVGSDTKTLAQQGLNQQQGLTYESELGESTQGLTPPPRHKTVAKVKPLKVKFFNRILTRKESGLLHRFLNAFLHRLRKHAFHYTPSHLKICCQALPYIPLHSITDLPTVKLYYCLGGICWEKYGL